MRLSPIEIAHIKECVVGFDPIAKVYLFGSRTDDTKKGGDIDLLIFSQTMDLHSKLELKGKLFQLFEEQKIDIIIEPDGSKPFVKLILEEAIKL
ncbi:MAG: nucleotidyltransferase domain-containing protein [Bacteroidales bacterium]|nr:nucleotidyltransferase domain-containing protein [Bacteroidales bacterium]